MSWPMVQISDVARVVGGATPKSGIPAYWDGDVRWATPKDLSGLESPWLDDTPRKITALGLKSCSSELLPAGSVLFSSRAPIGHVAINTVPVATNQGFKSFIPGPELNASFLYWWLRCHRSYLEGLGNGATFKEVSKAVVERIAIPLPPLPEQKRIADILNQADDIRHRRRQALSWAQALNQSYFDNRFSDRIANQDSDCRLIDLVDRARGISYGIVQRGGDVENGVPVVRIGDFVSGKLQNREFKRTSTKISQAYKRTVLSGGELLISIRGTVGRLAVAPDSIAGANVSREVAVIPLLPEISRDLILAFLRNGIVQKRITADVRGVAQSGINLEHLRVLRVPKFSEVEVKAFELEAGRCRAVENAHNAAHQNAEALFTSLQHRAFRGDL